MKLLVLGSLWRLVLAAVLVVGAGLSQASSPTVERVLERGSLKVGMSGDQPPLNMVSKRGDMIGFDVDMANAMAGALEVDLELVQLPFGQLLDALRAGKVDMVISGMAITAERARDISFVGPYMLSGKSLLTRSDELAAVYEAKQLNRKDLRLAALRNSTSQSFANIMAPDAELLLVDDYADAIIRLLDDQIDGLVADMPSCVLATMRYPGEGLKTLKAPLSTEPVGIAVLGSDYQFHALINNYLDTFTKMGLSTLLLNKWFVDSGWLEELP